MASSFSVDSEIWRPKSRVSPQNALRFYDRAAQALWEAVAMRAAFAAK